MRRATPTGCLTSSPALLLASSGTSSENPAEQTADHGRGACERPDQSNRRAYQRRWIAARRAEYFSGKSCSACGAAKSLELDHVDPALKVSHRIWSWSFERRAAELAKCRVLCAGCHRERHATERRKPLQHGTPNGYKKRGCRCARCRAWNTAYKSSLRIAPGFAAAEASL